MSVCSLKSRWQHWLGKSIANRFKATVFLLTFALLFAAGAVNFAYLLNQTYLHETHELSEHSLDLHIALTRSLDSMDEHIRLLSINPAVISAVLDTGNQETHLFPLLQRSQRRDTPLHNLCITDYKGRSLACMRSPRTDYAENLWLRRAITDNASQAHVVMSQSGRPMLHIAHPVSYESTGNAEGVVVGQFDLHDLIIRATGTTGHDFNHIHLSSTAGDIYVTGDHDTSIHQSAFLEPQNAAIAALQLRFGIGKSRATFFAPLLQLTVIYLLLALALAGCSYWVIGRTIPAMTSRIESLSAAARAVTPHKPFIFDFTTSGEDEVAQLAQAFDQMSRRLQQANISLEHLVIARTEELNQQRTMLQNIMDAVPGAIFQFRLRPDGSSQLPFVSRAITGLYGITPDEVSDDASPLFARVHPDDREAHLASIRASAQHLTPWQNEYRVLLPDGWERWLYGNALPKREPDGATLWHGIVSDITEHKNAELALAESEAYNKSLFAHSHIPLVIMDPASGCFVDCNDAAVTIYRMHNRLEVIGKTPLDVSAPLQYDERPSAEAAQAFIAEAQAKGFNVFEWRHQRPNGEIWDAEVRLMLFHHAGQKLMQFSLRDITDQKRSAAENWHKANFDPLTGLANRSLLRDRIDRAFAQARRDQSKVGLLYLDLDGFKGINDTLGHACGDDLLKQTALRLQSCVREQDTAARIGGDEFVLVIQDMATREDSKRVAECALETFQTAFALGDATRKLNTSIGIAVFPDDATTVDALLDCADRALYQSKRSGKGCFSFYST